MHVMIIGHKLLSFIYSFFLFFTLMLLYYFILKISGREVMRSASLVVGLNKKAQVKWSSAFLKDQSSCGSGMKKADILVWSQPRHSIF